MEPTPQPAPAFARVLHRITSHVSQDLLGGPRPWKLAWVINFQKGGTLLWVIGLMAYFDNWSVAAWTYAALHGSYGLLWLLKDAVFPDPNWEKKATIAGGLAAFALVLGPYWSFAYLLISNKDAVTPNWLIFACVFVYALGVAIMLVADAQKFFTLRVQRGLIETGMFRHIRHPNYLGEMMLYGSFAALTQHALPWGVLAWVWLGVFLPNMLNKEASMSRYPRWAAYKERTGMLLPPLRALWASAPPEAAPVTNAAPATTR